MLVALFETLRVRTITLGLLASAALTTSAFAGSVTVSSPKANSTVSGSVTIAASASESGTYHLELWDNGTKLGDYNSHSVSMAHSFAKGTHSLGVMAVSAAGAVLNKTVVGFTVSAASASEPASQSVKITSPAAGGSSINAVKIAASSNVSGTAKLAIWDNGDKLGVVSATSVNNVYVLPGGSHVLTVQALNSSNKVIDTSSADYTVTVKCSTTSTLQCNLDQLPMNNVQNDCNPSPDPRWVANPCGSGVQGVNPTNPRSTTVEAVTEGGSLANFGNKTLNGKSVHFSETQGSNPSNVLFRGQSANKSSTSTVDSHWVMDEYVYLPDPTAHQAFEMDSQYTIKGIWTKFYTECAFNHNNGTGYWGVFDTATGGWIFLDGTKQAGQTTPVVPCDRSQFQQPWSGSSDPSFTGWHHIAWTFLRNSDGTVTFKSLVFDGKTTEVNFKPNSETGGKVSDAGNFAALIQLDGVVNSDRKHDVVDAYVSEISLTHTP